MREIRAVEKSSSNSKLSHFQKEMKLSVYQQLMWERWEEKRIGGLCDKKVPTSVVSTRAAKAFVGNMNEDLAGVEDPNKGYFTVPWGFSTGQ